VGEWGSGDGGGGNKRRAEISINWLLIKGMRKNVRVAGKSPFPAGSGIAILTSAVGREGTTARRVGASQYLARQSW